MGECVRRSYKAAVWGLGWVAERERRERERETERQRERAYLFEVSEICIKKLG